jgi:putative RNA 2'-phosphotransferase
MTKDDKLKSISKFLSFVLRHEPHSIGLTLDEGGWADVSELLAKAGAAGKRMDRHVLQQVVDTSDKKRFAFSEDGLRIRANQGHSVEVTLGLEPVMPPHVLYHGTASRFLPSILSEGLERRQRHHVHLTENMEIAASVGQRYGKVVLLEVDASRRSSEGHLFFRSANGVWLTDSVPATYLKVLP